MGGTGLGTGVCQEYWTKLICLSWGLWSWLRYQGWWQPSAGVICCWLGVRFVFWGWWLLMAPLFPLQMMQLHTC